MTDTTHDDVSSTAGGRGILDERTAAFLQEGRIGAAPAVDRDRIPDDVDERYVDVSRALIGVIDTLQALHAANRNPYLAAHFARHLPEDYVAELEVALRTGMEHLAERDDRAALREDLGRLDDQAIADLEATLGQVAPHLGVDLELPPRGGDA